MQESSLEGRKKGQMRRGKGKKKIQTKNQTMQSIVERKASALLWVKWIESRSAEKLKMKQYFGAEEGNAASVISLLTTASRAALPVSHLDQYAASKYFPVKMQPCSPANFSLLIMTSFSELPCLDSLQVVCIFPGVLQTRGGNLQRSTKRGKWQEIT